MVIDVELDPLIHFPWKWSGLTPGTLVSIHSVFRFPTVDTVDWNAEMLAAKLLSLYF